VSDHWEGKLETHYDVIVIGAGLSGSFAAIEASKAGARVLLLEKRQQQDVGADSFAVYMMHRDCLSLELDLKSGHTTSTGFVNVTGRKIAFEFDYPDESALFDYMQSDRLLEAIHRRIRNLNGITLSYGCEATGLLGDEHRCSGVRLSNGDAITAEISIVCAGLDGPEQLGLSCEPVWPAPVRPFNGKAKVSVIFDHGDAAQRLRNKSYEFYQKGTFDFFILHSMGEKVCCEGSLADCSPDEAIERFNALFGAHPVAVELLGGSAIAALTPRIYTIHRFGVIEKASLPGLFIAGTALGAESPAYFVLMIKYYLDYYG